MFESVVSSLLNKHLGAFVENLDSENLNLGIFGGDLELYDLRLKADALSFLDLPIEVKRGNIGKVSIKICWTSLYSQPVVVHVEDVFILATPVAGSPYDQDKEDKLAAATKERLLAQLENKPSLDKEQKGFVENLATTVINNVQVFVRNVHIRYEDWVTVPDCSFACGICLQGISAETTNSKWKPAQINAEAKSVFKLVRIESFSFYWNPLCSVRNLIKTQVLSNNWKTAMKTGLENFSVNSEPLDFICKPMSAKIKLIINKSGDVSVPRLLVDFLLQDAAVQLTRQQYLSIVGLYVSFQRMKIYNRYRKYHPPFTVKGHSKDWWIAAYRAVLEEYIRPYSWQRIKTHRDLFRKYKTLFKRKLKRELTSEEELNRVRQQLDAMNILLAEEESKIELSNEDPDLVEVLPVTSSSWWKPWLWSYKSSSSQSESVDEAEMEISVRHEGKSFVEELSPEEKYQLYDAIGYSEKSILEETPKQYIEYKLNFTLANCLITCVNYDHDVIVITLTQVLMSIETRPSVKAFKVSSRIESLTVEGITLEDEIVPILSTNVFGKISSTHVFTFDMETNPVDIEADYSLTLLIEPLEIMYNKHAMTEILTFFTVGPWSKETVSDVAMENLVKLTHMSKAGIIHAIESHKKMSFNIDVRSPYLILPPYGSQQREGSVLVLDLGRLRVKSDLQSVVDFEEMTRTELEEKLYDRTYILLSDLQIIFADAGDEWRSRSHLVESDFHLIPKLQAQVIFSKSIRPSYTQLPRYKVNTSVTSAQLSLSDRKLGYMYEFLKKLPLPEVKSYEDVTDNSMFSAVCLTKNKDMILYPALKELRRVKRTIDRIHFGAMETCDDHVMGDPFSADLMDTTDISDEVNGVIEPEVDECQQWARGVDLPGFDDNVSRSNQITTLFRFTIGELVIHLARSSDYVDKPYLMMRVDDLCFDLATMTYGPAFQLCLRSFQLVDKLHSMPSGEYLELIASSNTEDMLSVRYRQVTPDCPEFNTNFHSVEQSLVFDVGAINSTFHRGSIMTLIKFSQYVLNKIGLKTLSDIPASTIPSKEKVKRYWDKLEKKACVPIPAGATKFSCSVRSSQINLHLCDTDINFANLRISEIDGDWLCKANDKVVLQAKLTSIKLEDLYQGSLYYKILSVEEDNFLEVKFIKHAPIVTKIVDDTSPITRPDAMLKFKLGKIQFAFVYKFLNDMKHFLDGFVSLDSLLSLARRAEKNVQREVEDITSKGTKVQLSLQFHEPSLLIAHRNTSPDALVFGLGNLVVENFFTEKTSLKGVKYAVDNMLIKFMGISLSRGLMSLDGSLFIQEPILEPLKVNIDLKKVLGSLPQEVLRYDASCGMDKIQLNVGRRDLSVLLSVYHDIIQEKRTFDMSDTWRPLSPLEPQTPAAAHGSSEESIVKLQAFFTQPQDTFPVTKISTAVDGLALVFYDDFEEVVSSPVRDLSHGLARLEMGEVECHSCFYNDGSADVMASLQSLTLEDIRPNVNTIVKKIFHSYQGTDVTPSIKVSMPPMIDVSYKHGADSSSTYDVIIERIRFNANIAFFLSMSRFISGALASSTIMSNALYTVVGIQDNPRTPTQHDEQCGLFDRPPSSQSSTSGYISYATMAPEERSCVSVTARIKHPEIIVLPDSSKDHCDVLVLKTEVMVDMSTTPTEDMLTVSVSNLQVLSCAYGKRNQTAFLVLSPCDIEVSKNIKYSDESELTVKVLSSPLDLRLSGMTVHILTEVLDEILHFQSNYPLDTETEDTPQTTADLWSHKNVKSQLDCKQSTVYSRCKRYTETILKEQCSLSFPSINVILEQETMLQRLPVLFMESNLTATLNNWSSDTFHMNGEFRFSVNFFNEKMSLWEPLVETIMEKETVYRPWEILFKAFHAPSCLLAGCQDGCELDSPDGIDLEKSPSVGCTLSTVSHSTTVSDDDDDDDDDDDVNMRIIRTTGTHFNELCRTNCLVAPGSDTESEEGVSHLVSGLTRLFSSDEEYADSQDSSDSSDTEDRTESICYGKVTKHSSRRSRSKSRDKTGEDRDVCDVTHCKLPTSTCILIESRDKLNINVTPAILQAILDLWASFTDRSKDYQRIVHAQDMNPDKEEFILRNELGEESSIILMRAQDNSSSEHVVLQKSSFGMDSPPSSIASTPGQESSISESEIDMDRLEQDNYSIFSAFALIGNAVLKTGLGDTLCGPFDIDHSLDCNRKLLEININGFDKCQYILPNKVSNNLIPIISVDKSLRYHLFLNLDITNGLTTITLSSPLQLFNRLAYPINVYYSKNELASLGSKPIGVSTNPFDDKVRLMTVEPDQKLAVPLHVAYNCQLFFQPASLEYHVSDKGLWWKDFVNKQMPYSQIICEGSANQGHVFSFLIYGESGGPTEPEVSPKETPNVCFKMVPAFTVHNHLPFGMEATLPNEHKIRLEAGEFTHVHNLNIIEKQAVHIKVPSYLDLNWCGKIDVNLNSEPHKAIQLVSEKDTEGGNKHLSLGIYLLKNQGLQFNCYSPYWIVNKTGLPIQIRGARSDFTYDVLKDNEPILFRFRRNHYRKLRLRVVEASWSSAFPVDTPGTAGLVICRDRQRKRKYEILMTVSMCQMKFSKMIILRPHIVVHNQTDVNLSYMENNEDADLWNLLKPGATMNFWPMTESLQMAIKYEGSNTQSVYFCFMEVQRTVLRMDNGTALTVVVENDPQSPWTVLLRNYRYGDAPVRIDNYCEDLFLKINQKNLGQVVLLSPYKSMLYTWDDPSREKVLMWNTYTRSSNSFQVHLDKDNYGSERVILHTLRHPSASVGKCDLRGTKHVSIEQEGSSSDDSDSEDPTSTKANHKTRKDKVTVHWVSYMDDHQRVVMFTQDERMAKRLRCIIDNQYSKLEVCGSLEGLSVSLTTGDYKEIAYMSVNSVPPVWEANISGKWKSLTLEMTTWLEDKWTQNATNPTVDKLIEVNFQKMELVKPFFAPLRRSYFPGIWLQYRSSNHFQYYSLKVQHIQIDNQLPDAEFPCVVYPSPISSLHSGLKPFFELSLLRYCGRDGNKVKSFEALIQEITINLDRGFIMTMYYTWSPLFTDLKEKTRFIQDLNTAYQSDKYFHDDTDDEVLEYCHVSPIKLKISFSPRGTVYNPSKESNSLTDDILQYFMLTIGATLTEVRNVEIKAAYFEVENIHYNSDRLLECVKRHYCHQLVQQFYVFVFGLEVLGNPYGLIKDVYRGVSDFFYEPIVGALQGPEKLTSGLTLGAKSLLGNVIGGTAMSIAQITGSLADTAIVLSFDQDYRKMRQIRLQQASELPNSLLSASSGFVQGVVLGLTGVITQPVLGLQENGVEGFFTGMGKGLFGLLTKPCSGILDLVTAAFNAIHRAATFNSGFVTRARLPRYIHPGLGLKPFSPYQARGLRLLHLLKSTYSQSDVYWTHAALSTKDKPDVCLVTNNHIFLLERCQWWHGWDIEWVIKVKDLTNLPNLVEKRLYFRVRQLNNDNIVSGKDYYIECEDVSVLEWLEKKIVKLIQFEQEAQPCLRCDQA